MAIRSNIGNQVTNAMQILSIGATTAAARLGHAEDSLVNRTEDEKKDIALRKYNRDKAHKQMQYAQSPEGIEREKIVEETKKLNEKYAYEEAKRKEEKGFSPYQHLTSKEVREYQKQKAENIRNNLSGMESIDTYLEDVPSTYEGNLVKESIKNRTSFIYNMNNKETQFPQHEVTEIKE